jgi:FAD-dependent urate hydroxylase
MPATDALVIGAGPFGLSISAHLRALGVEHMIVGRPVDTWRRHMPHGMNLKSEPYGSVIAAPRGGYDIAAYSAAHGLDYIDRVQPLSLEHWLSYADWFTSELVPDVRDLTVTSVTATVDAFNVEFADAEPVTARQVIIATGLLAHKNLPRELAGLPSDLVTHSADQHDLTRFRGRRVAVIGAGQSALETAALAHEQGADVRVIARAPQIYFVDPNAERVTPMGWLRMPVTKLCEGWGCIVWASPVLFRRLPERARIHYARTVLGPAGSWWLRERVEGVLDTLPGHRIREAAPSGSGVRLSIDGPTATTMDVDHVIAGTGFRPKVAELPFLAEDLRARIPVADGYPVLTRSGESAVPGLYFAGALAAASLGPSQRFIAGTHRSVPQLARAIARRAEGRAKVTEPPSAAGLEERLGSTAR